MSDVNVQQRKYNHIIKISIVVFISVIFLSFLITYLIYLYNKKNRNVQTPFFTLPYISLLTEIFSITILLLSGIYFLIYY